MSPRPPPGHRCSSYLSLSTTRTAGVCHHTQLTFNFFFKTVLSYSHATLNSQVPCPSIPFASALGVCLSAWLFLLVSGWSKAPSLGLKRQLCEECLLRFPRTHGWFLTPPCGSSSQNLEPSCGIYTQTHSTSAHTDTLT